MIIEELTPEDQAALEKENQLGHRICKHYLVQEWDGSIETLDTLFDLWKKDINEVKPSANQMAIGLGALCGDFLCQNLQCKWVVITDSIGCNLGLLNIPDKWQFFPRLWIAKRVNEAPGHNLLTKIIGSLQRNALS